MENIGGNFFAFLFSGGVIFERKLTFVQSLKTLISNRNGQYEISYTAQIYSRKG